MNYNVTVNGKVYSVTVEKTGAAPAAAPVAAPVAAAPVAAPARFSLDFISPALACAGEMNPNSRNYNIFA